MIRFIAVFVVVMLTACPTEDRLQASTLLGICRVATNLGGQAAGPFLRRSVDE